MLFVSQLHQTHLKLVVDCYEQVLFIFLGYQLVNLFYLDDFRCVRAYLAIFIDNRVLGKMFDLGKLILFMLFTMPLKDKERVALTHYKQEIPSELNHMLD